MSIFFADTSALAKRYIRETGSTWVSSWIEPSFGNIIVIAELALVEMRAAFSRRLRDGTLSAANITQLRNDFLLHAQNEYLIVHLDTPILAQAARLTDNHPLRTLDAIQLACALRAVYLLAEPITFVSADENLLSAAAAEGFIIDNPHAHS